jgi:hypothetical protein
MGSPAGGVSEWGKCDPLSTPTEIKCTYSFGLALPNAGITSLEFALNMRKLREDLVH